MDSHQHRYHIYTDGACSGNPGAGGWAAIVEDPQGNASELSGGYKLTTNNRMELMAVIGGLRQIPHQASAKVTTDSQYVVNAIQKGWLTNWQNKQWRNAQKKPVANRDLWEELLILMKDRDISFQWVRGHVGHPKNEMCDRLAVAAYSKKPQTIDEGFVDTNLQRKLL